MGSRNVTPSATRHRETAGPGPSLHTLFNATEKEHTIHSDASARHHLAQYKTLDEGTEITFDTVCQALLDLTPRGAKTGPVAQGLRAMVYVLKELWDRERGLDTQLERWKQEIENTVQGAIHNLTTAVDRVSAPGTQSTQSDVPPRSYAAATARNIPAEHILLYMWLEQK